MAQTYDAFNGEQFYNRPLPDGTHSVGANEPDQSIVGFLGNTIDGRAMVDYLTRIQITPVGLVHAFNACFMQGVSTFHALCNTYPEVAAWYATQEQLVVMSMPPVAPPEPESVNLTVHLPGPLLARLRMCSEISGVALGDIALVALAVMLIREDGAA